jgi:hypothetical protein
LAVLTDIKSVRVASIPGHRSLAKVSNDSQIIFQPDGFFMPAFEACEIALTDSAKLKQGGFYNCEITSSIR